MSSLLWNTVVASSVASSLPPISSFNLPLLSQGDLSRAPTGTLLVSHYWGLGTHMLTWSPKTLLHRGPPALSSHLTSVVLLGTYDHRTLKLFLSGLRTILAPEQGACDE